MDEEVSKQFFTVFRSLLSSENGVEESAFVELCNLGDLLCGENDPEWKDLCRQVDAVDGNFFIPQD